MKSDLLGINLWVTITILTHLIQDSFTGASPTALSNDAFLKSSGVDYEVNKAAQEEFPTNQHHIQLRQAYYNDPDDFGGEARPGETAQSTLNNGVSVGTRALNSDRINLEAIISAISGTSMRGLLGKGGRTKDYHWWNIGGTGPAYLSGGDRNYHWWNMGGTGPYFGPGAERIEEAGAYPVRGTGAYPVRGTGAYPVSGTGAYLNNFRGGVGHYPGGGTGALYRCAAGPVSNGADYGLDNAAQEEVPTDQLAFQQRLGGEYDNDAFRSGSSRRKTVKLASSQHSQTKINRVSGCASGQCGIVQYPNNRLISSQQTLNNFNKIGGCVSAQCGGLQYSGLSGATGLSNIGGINQGMLGGVTSLQQSQSNFNKIGCVSGQCGGVQYNVVPGAMGLSSIGGMNRATMGAVSGSSVGVTSSQQSLNSLGGAQYNGMSGVTGLSNIGGMNRLSMGAVSGNSVGVSSSQQSLNSLGGAQYNEMSGVTGLSNIGGINHAMLGGVSGAGLGVSEHIHNNLNNLGGCVGAQCQKYSYNRAASSQQSQQQIQNINNAGGCVGGLCDGSMGLGLGIGFRGINKQRGLSRSANGLREGRYTGGLGFEGATGQEVNARCGIGVQLGGEVGDQEGVGAGCQEVEEQIGSGIGSQLGRAIGGDELVEGGGQLTTRDFKDY